MKTNFIYKQNFDRSMIKSAKMQKIAKSAFYLMLLTLPPYQFVFYVKAINQMDYKVAIKFLRAVDRHYHIMENHQLPLVGNEQAQQLLILLLLEMHESMDEYNGGFLYGIMNELEYEQDSPEHEIIKELCCRIFDRLESYIINECEAAL